MKRIFVLALAGIMGVLLTTGDASAWKKRYRYRSYQGSHSVLHHISTSSCPNIHLNPKSLF